MDWNSLTALGSAALVWPGVIAVGLLLWPSQDQPAQVLRWWLGLGIASLMVATTKVFFYAWGTGITRWDLTCFSGHAMLSGAFWPVALAALAGTSVPSRTMGFLAGSALALGVAYSRVVLGAHPVSEALAGSLLGSVVGMLGLKAVGKNTHSGRWKSASGVAVLVASTFVLVSVERIPHLPTEAWLQRVALVISGRDSPVDRLRWRIGSIEGLPGGDARRRARDEYNGRLT